MPAVCPAYVHMWCPKNTCLAYLYTHKVILLYFYNIYFLSVSWSLKCKPLVPVKLGNWLFDDQMSVCGYVCHFTIFSRHVSETFGLLFVGRPCCTSCISWWNQQPVPFGFSRCFCLPLFLVARSQQSRCLNLNVSLTLSLDASPNKQLNSIKTAANQIAE